jgi:hypothetical protein
MVRRQLQLVYLRVQRCRDIQKGFAIRASAFRMLSPPQGRNGENRRSYPFDNVEHIVVGGLREQLGIEETIRNFIKCYTDERQRKMIEGGDKAARAATKRHEVERQRERAASAIIAGRICRRGTAAHMPMYAAGTFRRPSGNRWRRETRLPPSRSRTLSPAAHAA